MINIKKQSLEDTDEELFQLINEYLKIKGTQYEN